VVSCGDIFRRARHPHMLHSRECGAFFPVVNSVNINAPNICGQGGPLSVAMLRAMSKAVIDDANIISVKVDAIEVKEK
jgi:hypothetical protein